VSRPNPTSTARTGQLVAVTVLANLLITGLVVVALRWPSSEPIRLIEPAPSVPALVGEGEIGVERAVQSLDLAAIDSSNSTLVDINAASATDLDALPGIGPTLAGRVIRYREEHGPFSTIEELMNVQGIGTATLDKMRGLITVR